MRRLDLITRRSAGAVALAIPVIIWLGGVYALATGRYLLGVLVTVGAALLLFVVMTLLNVGRRRRADSPQPTTDSPASAWFDELLDRLFP